MTLKFSRNSHRPYTPSKLQRIQWDQFAALGYSMAIKGYLLCWKHLLVRAGITDPAIIWPIDEVISVSKQAADRARWNLKNLRSIKP